MAFLTAMLSVRVASKTCTCMDMPNSSASESPAMLPDPALPAVPHRCPWLTRAVSPAVPVYNGIIFLFVLANFSMATFMDPGVFPRGRTFCRDRLSALFH